ncbi:unnamed protein product, partial [Adineta ricciae]
MHEQAKELSPSSTLHATNCSQCIVSFSQRRIWLDLQLIKDSLTQPTFTNIIIPVIVKSSTVSIERVRSAVLSVLLQHKILRTSVLLHPKINQLEKKVQPVANNDCYSFQLTCGIDVGQDIHNLLSAETRLHFADIENGLLLRCHVIKISITDVGHLYPGDLIVFSVHPIAFDVNSIKLFYDSFVEAYHYGRGNATPLQYIDCTLYENAAETQTRNFWSMLMHNYNWNKDNPLLSISKSDSNIRSGSHHSVILTLENSLVDTQEKFVLFHDISIFQLNLACYFAFLYSLTNGTITDLSVISSVNTRSLPEMTSIIGPFINLLPYRIQIIQNESFSDFILRVKRLCSDIREHALYFYQTNSDPNNVPVMQKSAIYFEYVPKLSSSTHETPSQDGKWDATFDLYEEKTWTLNCNTTPYDFSLTVFHDNKAKTIQYLFQCSAQLCDRNVLSETSQLFLDVLTHLLSSNNDAFLQPLSFLPTDEITATTFHRLPNVLNSGPASYAQARIWLDEQVRFDPDKPQVAIYNMPFLYHILPSA